MSKLGSTLILKKYAEAAHSAEVATNNYRGLAIHALYVAPHEKIAEWAQELLRPGANILDLGSGTGALALRLQDLGFQVTASDAVPENFRLHGQIAFAPADLNTDFSAAFNQTFDAITATELIEHIENPRHFVRECRRLLKPGGKLLLSTPNVDSSISRVTYVRSGDFRMFSDDYYRGDGHITPVSLSLLKRVFGETGFRLQKVDSVGTLTFSFLSWWRMRLIAFLFRKISQQPNQENDILLVAAERIEA